MSKKANQFIEDLTPEELVYLKFVANVKNDTPIVENEVLIKTDVKTIGWLFKMVTEGKIKSLSPYLQRILLTKVWRANNFTKSKSYIRDIWKGLGQTTPFFLVPLDLVLSNIEQVESEITDKDVLAQIEEVKNKILEFQTDNVELINLDGQTRSNESIVPYLKSEYNLISTDDASAINVLNGKGVYEDISQKVFSELNDIQKGYFFHVPLLVNILMSGSLDDITNSLISINSNEKWTKWQEIYHGTWISIFPKRIHEVYESEESGIVKDFFTNKIKDAGKYTSDVSGWEQWIAEHLYFLKNKQFPTMDNLKSVFKQSGVDVPTTIQSTQLRKYLIELQQNYTSDKMLMHQFVSDWCLFRDVIDNGSTKGNAYYQLYSGKKLKVLSIPQLFTWFTKTVDTLTTPEFIDELTGDTIVNDKSYMYDGRNIVQKGDSYPSHKAGGFGYQSIIGRIKILINEFNDSFDDLAKNRIISTTKSMAPTSQVFASNNYRSNAGTLIDPTKKASDKYERGHVTSRKNEGSDELGNLKPQIKKANRSYSGRNMTKKK